MESVLLNKPCMSLAHFCTLPLLLSSAYGLYTAETISRDPTKFDKDTALAFLTPFSFLMLSPGNGPRDNRTSRSKSTRRQITVAVTILLKQFWNNLLLSALAKVVFSAPRAARRRSSVAEVQTTISLVWHAEFRREKNLAIASF